MTNWKTEEEAREQIKALVADYQLSSIQRAGNRP